MADKENLQLFENTPIRTAWDEDNEEWFFAIVDVIAVLTESKDPSAYWRKLKQRLKAEGNETVTNCHGLKLKALMGSVESLTLQIRSSFFVSFSQFLQKRLSRLSCGLLRSARIALKKPLILN